MDLITVDRLPHLHGAQLIQTLGVHFGEAGRHMLNDDHAGNVGGQALEYFQRGLCPACGGTQTDDGVVQIHAARRMSQRNGC